MTKMVAQDVTYTREGSKRKGYIEGPECLTKAQVEIQKASMMILKSQRSMDKSFFQGQYSKKGNAIDYINFKLIISTDGLAYNSGFHMFGSRA